MGDSNRHNAFAAFLRKNYPRAKTVLCVADGQGELARKLANKGFEVTAIENRPRFKGRTHPSIHYTKGWFTRNTPVPQDLVVGMHPDEATAEIVLAGVKNKKPWAVVPCCVKGEEARGINGFTDWLSKLKRLANNDCNTGVLKISGKNIVLYKR